MTRERYLAARIAEKSFVMKRRNVEGSVGKLRRNAKRSKLNNDGCSSLSWLMNFKFMIVWIVVMILDFISELRFELLYPFYVFVSSLGETYRCKGVMHLFLYIFVTMTIDMYCYFLIPIHWLYFASSTYIWLQFTWYSEKGFTSFSILIWISLISTEMFVRLRNELTNDLPLQLEICRPFAAHGVGYTIVSLMIVCQAYIEDKLRLQKKSMVAKTNNFYFSLINKAVYPEKEQMNLSTTKNLKNNIEINDNQICLKHNCSLDNSQLKKQTISSSSLLAKNSIQPNRSVTLQNSSNINETNHNHSSLISVPTIKSPQQQQQQKVGNEVTLKQASISHQKKNIVSQKQEIDNTAIVNNRNDQRKFLSLTNIKFYSKLIMEKTKISLVTKFLNDLILIKILILIKYFLPKVLISFVTRLFYKNYEKVNIEENYSMISENDYDNEKTKNGDCKVSSKSQNGHTKKVISNSINGSIQINEASNKNLTQKNELKNLYDDEFDLEFSSSSVAKTNNDQFNKEIEMQDNLCEQQNNVNSEKLSSTSSNSNGANKNNGKIKHKTQQNRMTTNDDLLQIIKSKDDLIWKVELDNQRLKSDLQTMRQYESDLRKQMDSLKNEEKVFKNSITNYQNSISNLQKKLKSFSNSKQQDKQIIQKLEKELDDERKKSKASIELPTVSEKKYQFVEQNSARFTSMVATNRNNCTKNCHNRQREYEYEIACLRRELIARDQQAKLKEMLQGEFKDFKNKRSSYLSTIKNMYEKSHKLEESLKTENKLKTELLAKIEESKRRFNKQKMKCLQLEKELMDIKKHSGKSQHQSINIKSHAAKSSANRLNNKVSSSSSSSPLTSNLNFDLINRCLSSCSTTKNSNTVKVSSPSPSPSPLLSSNVPPAMNMSQPLVMNNKSSHHSNTRSSYKNNVSPGSNRLHNYYNKSHNVMSTKNNSTSNHTVSTISQHHRNNHNSSSSGNTIDRNNDYTIDSWNSMNHRPPPTSSSVNNSQFVIDTWDAKKCVSPSLSANDRSHINTWEPPKLESPSVPLNDRSHINTWNTSKFGSPAVSTSDRSHINTWNASKFVPPPAVNERFPINTWDAAKAGSQSLSLNERFPINTWEAPKSGSQSSSSNNTWNSVKSASPSLPLNDITRHVNTWDPSKYETTTSLASTLSAAVAASADDLCFSKSKLDLDSLLVTRRPQEQQPLQQQQQQQQLSNFPMMMNQLGINNNFQSNNFNNSFNNGFNSDLKTTNQNNFNNFNFNLNNNFANNIANNNIASNFTNNIITNNNQFPTVNHSNFDINAFQNGSNF